MQLMALIPFPTCRHFLMLLQEKNIESIVAKGEQILHLSQCFKLFSVIILSFPEIFHILADILSTWSATDLWYVVNS